MFESLLASLASALDNAGIPYMVIGGQAVLQYGEPRLTRDIDITLGVDVDEFQRVSAAIRAIELRVAVDDAETFLRRTNVLPLHHPKSGVRVDLLFSFHPYERDAIARSTIVNIRGQSVRFAAVEDVIIYKIIAGRPRDLDDVNGILVRNAGYDKAYVLTVLRAFEQSLSKPFVDTFNKIDADTTSR
jgi:predicted nucleotidyltransferase